MNLIAGLNGVGKSTVREGLRFAFTGDPGRVSLKKDYDALLSDGAKSGTVRVDEKTGAILRQVEDGKRVSTGEICGIDIEALGPALPLILDADTLARQSTDERRRQLFAIAGIDIGHVDVTERLQQRGLTGGDYEPILDHALHHIRIDGFDGGHKHCRETARDAKARWRAVTGEAYGAKKAEGWQPEAVAFDTTNQDKLVAQRDKLEQRVGQLRERIGALRAQADTPVDESERKRLETVAGELAQRQHHVADLEQQLDAARQQQAEANAQARTEAEAAEQERAAEARASDQHHRKQINNAAADAMRGCGITDEQAKALVRQIALQQVPHVSIRY